MSYIQAVMMKFVEFLKEYPYIITCETFFVESYSKQKLFVLFITSDNTPKAWGAMTEIGASWITQIDNKIFNIPPFKPQHPLNDEALWHSTNRNEENVLSMNLLMRTFFLPKKVEHNL